MLGGSAYNTMRYNEHRITYLYDSSDTQGNSDIQVLLYLYWI